MLTPFCGAGKLGFSNGRRFESRVHFAYALVADPLHKQGKGWYISDAVSIRYFDETTDTVSLVAGGAEPGGIEFATGADARFWHINSLLIASDGLTLWASNYDNGAIRRIDPQTRKVSAPVSGYQMLRAIVWDRATPTQPAESVMYFGCRTQINRFTIWTPGGDSRGWGRRPGVTTVWESKNTYCRPNALTVTPTGHILWGCGTYRAIGCLDPRTGHTHLMANFKSLSADTTATSAHSTLFGSFVLSDHTRELWYVMSETNSQLVVTRSTIRKLTLSPNLFLVPKCCLVICKKTNRSRALHCLLF